MPATDVFGALLGIISLAILVHVVAGGYRVAGHGPGGALGEHLGEILRAVVSTVGTALLGLVGLVVAAVVATPLRMRDVLRAIGGVARAVGGTLWRTVRAFARFWGDVFRAMLPERRDDAEDDDAEEIDERDVLEVGDDEGCADPVIIGRPVKKKKPQPVLEAVEELEAGDTTRTPIEVV